MDYYTLRTGRRPGDIVVPVCTYSLAPEPGWMQDPQALAGAEANTTSWGQSQADFPHAEPCRSDCHHAFPNPPPSESITTRVDHKRGAPHLSFKKVGWGGKARKGLWFLLLTGQFTLLLISNTGVLVFFPVSIRRRSVLEAAAWIRKIKRLRITTFTAI